MSMWLNRLSQVSSLLEKLDDQVETVVEERVIAKTIREDGEEDDFEQGHGTAIDDILAKRGLAVAQSAESKEEEEEEEENEEEEADVHDSPDFEDLEGGLIEVNHSQEENKATITDPPQSPDQENIAQSINHENIDTLTAEVAVISKKEEQVPLERNSLQSQQTLTHQESADKSKPDDTISKTLNADSEENGNNQVLLSSTGAGNSNSAESITTNQEKDATETTKQPPHPPPPPPPPLQPKSKSQQSTAATASVPTTTTTTTTSKSKTREMELVQKEKQMQKEVRQLRRHVVTLNTTLEEAETEIQALRGELARAAERMETDRARAKEQKEASQKQATEQLAVQKSFMEQSLKEQKQRYEEQISGYKQKVAELENRRKQEGGDWNKELSQALEREQTISQQLAMMEDEKSILLSQISTLQNQQASLGLRLESLTQAADNAMAREREAEDRLDATLSQHARQISQRQSREAELERTIQELNAALVLAGNKITISPDSQETGRSTEAALRARTQTLENELELIRSQLSVEKEKSEALHQELKESTMETSGIQSKHLQLRLQVAELESTISRLESELREAKKQKTNNGNDVTKASQQNYDADRLNQVKELSEEVLRLREMLANSSSESKTLRSRLQAALQRATKAEDELVAATASGGNDTYDSMERANSMGGSTPARRRRLGGPPSGSIRSVMRLNSGQGDRTEQLGKVVDAVDSFAVTTGRYLRKNPMARAVFIVYLLLVHLWTFVVLFFHAHNFEDPHMVPGAELGVGPHALVAQQNQLNHEDAMNVLHSIAKAEGASAP